MAATRPLIQLKDVSFTRNHEPILNRISLKVETGDYVGVIGPNGGGKTTLLRIMLGLLEPEAGEVKLFGQAPADFGDWWKVGYVPQKATSFETRFPVTVEEVVSLGRVSKRRTGRRLGPDDHQAVQQALEQVGMAEHRRRLITELSGGQQQRVFIAKALASGPKVLLLDEPAVGIDVKAQDQFYQLLSSLNKDTGLTIVMVSHDIDVVVNEVTKIACINETLIYHGSPTDFMKDDYMTQLYGKARKFILHGH
jgi:zinc transport system ATP-binding protein